MRTAVALSIATNIALPAKPRPTKWRTRSAAIVRSRSGRVISCVLACRSAATSWPSCVLVELGLLEDLGQLLVEALVDELQLGDAVLVVERDRRAVLDRVAEVVDRDVVAELLRASAPRPTISGVPVKPMNAAFGSAWRMFSASVSYWLRCASSVMTITSSRSESTGISVSPVSQPELVDQREDVAVVRARAARAGARASSAWTCASR